MIAQIEQFLLLWCIANFVSLAIAFVCFKFPETGQRIFALIFLIACLLNASLAIFKSSVYLEYGRFSILSIYEEFIYGTFSRHTTIFVLPIAMCQMVVGFGLLSKGKYRLLAIMGALVFLFAIVPLGVGSGFPATLFLIAGLWHILVKNGDPNGRIIREKREVVF